MCVTFFSSKLILHIFLQTAVCVTPEFRLIICELSVYTEVRQIHVNDLRLIKRTFFFFPFLFLEGFFYNNKIFVIIKVITIFLNVIEERCTEF